jgi:hypothetical protein
MISAHAMEICHAHNLITPAAEEKPFGIRVSIRPGDSFARLLDSGWEQYHWFATPEERDRALRDMESEHVYSRRGDRPTLLFEPVEE